MQAARAAERALQEQARLPELGARVEHTGREVRTAAEIEAQYLAQMAKRLEEARNAYYERRNTQLPGGDEAALAERIHAEMGLGLLGVSLERFQNHLKTAGQPSGENAARVTAGMGSRGTPGSTGPHAPQKTDMFGPDSPEELNARLLRDGVLIESDASHARRPPLTAEEEKALVEFLEDHRKEDSIRSQVNFFSRDNYLPPFLQKLRNEADEVLAAMRQVTGLALKLEVISFRMTPANVDMDIHRDNACFRYLRRLSAVGTPTTYYPPGGPTTLHQAKGAVVAGTFWRPDWKKWHAYKDRIESLRERGYAINYRAIPHGVIATPGLRVGERGYFEASPAGPRATGPQPDPGRRLLMIVDIVPAERPGFD
jgi:hypothetical protein